MTQYTYDDAGQMVTVVVDPADAKQTVQQTYDGAGRVIQTVDEAGVVSTLQYDKRSRVVTKTTDTATLKHVTAHTYGGLDLPLSDAILDVHTPTAFKKAKTLDVFGRVTEIVEDPDALKIATQQIFDAANRVVVEINGEGHPTYLVRDAIGQMRYHINPAGGVTEHQYDKIGKQTAEIKYTNAVDTSSFKSALPTVEQVAGLIKTDPTDTQAYTIYSADGHVVYRLTRCDAVTGGAINPARLVGYVLDKAGRPILTTEYSNFIELDTLESIDQASLDAAKQPSVRDQLTYRFYDAKGQCRYHFDGEGAVTEYRYNDAGQVCDEFHYATLVDLSTLSVSDSLDDIAKLVQPSDDDRHTQTLYDALGNQRYQLRCLTATTAYVDEYHYDARNVLQQTRHYQTVLILPSTVNIDNVSDAITIQKLADDTKDRVNVYTYDGLKRKSAVQTCPANLGYHESWMFDALNHTLTHTDRLGQVWAYTYDGAGRKVSSKTPPIETSALALNAAKTAYALADPVTAALVTTFTYDHNHKIVNHDICIRYSASSHTHHHAQCVRPCSDNQRKIYPSMVYLLHHLQH